MVYDAHRHKTVLHGGSVGMSYFCDTWEYDQTNGWVKINTPTKVLPLRDKVAYCYDRFRKKTILYGGGTLYTSFVETWEYDGNDWQKIETPHNPSYRRMSVMAYMPKKYKAVLFGNGPGSIVKDDTWFYNGVIIGSP
ncbi:hypothetical protein JXQ70_10235 [bacterium]|nr:hypothetical protein [bacterium]